MWGGLYGDFGVLLDEVFVVFLVGVELFEFVLYFLVVGIVDEDVGLYCVSWVGFIV